MGLFIFAHYEHQAHNFKRLFFSFINGWFYNQNKIHLTSSCVEYLFICFFCNNSFVYFTICKYFFFFEKGKRGHPKLFKQACKRANGSSGSSINVATLFDENKIFDQLKNPSLIREFHFVKRVVIFSMVSFLTLIVLYFV